jgi:hypothetical protein
LVFRWFYYLKIVGLILGKTLPIPPLIAFWFPRAPTT